MKADTILSLGIVGVVLYAAYKFLGTGASIFQGVQEAAAEAGKATADWIDQILNPPGVYGGSPFWTPQWQAEATYRSEVQAGAQAQGLQHVFNQLNPLQYVLMTPENYDLLNKEFDEKAQEFISQGLTGDQIKALYWQRAQELQYRESAALTLLTSEPVTTTPIFAPLTYEELHPGQQPIENYGTGIPDYPQSEFQRQLWLKGLQSIYTPTAQDILMTAYAQSLGEPVFTTRFTGGGTWGINVPESFNL